MSDRTCTDVRKFLSDHLSGDGWNDDRATIDPHLESCADRYLFEVERGDGDVRGSQPIAPGNGRTSWKTRLVLTPGETVKWRVRVIREGLRVAAVASASFVPKAPLKKEPRRNR